MNFRIVWLRDALDDVSQIWEAANAIDRFEIRAAIEDLRDALQSDPKGVGESRNDARRIVFRWPLFAFYEVDEQRGVIWVASVGRLRTDTDQ